MTPDDKRLTAIAQRIFDDMKIQEPEKFAQYERLKDPLFWEARRLIAEADRAAS